MRATRSSLQMADATFEDLGLYSGIFADFLVRFWRKERMKPVLERKEATAIMLKIIDGDPASKEVKSWGLSYAASVLRRECLMDGLMRGVTEESKAVDLFPKTGLSTMMSWLRDYMLYKRQTRILRAEVTHWMIKSKLAGMSAPPVQESIWQKKERRDHFWSDFHDRARVLENGPLGRCLQAPPPSLATLNRPSTAASEAKSKTGSRPGSAWCDSPSSEAAAVEVFGMRWDFEQADRGKKSTAATVHGTNAERVEVLIAKKSGVGHSMKDGKSLSGSRSMPNLVPVRPMSTAGRQPIQSFDSAAETLRPGTAMSTPMSVASHGRRKGSEKLPPVKKKCELRLWQECDMRHIAPMPISFVTGHSDRLVANNKGLTDSDLAPLAAMLAECSSVREVDLFDNSLITDKGMVLIMQHLSRPLLQGTLEVLNLGRCTRLGAYTLDFMVTMLQYGGCLRELNLSQVPIATRFQLPLCKAIGKHVCLERVNLAETGMQSHDMTIECLGALLSGKNLRTLDLGWNNFDGKVMKALGGFVLSNMSLTKLALANCSSTSDCWGRVAQNKPVSSDQFVPPLSRFLEMLAKDESLTDLDISMNRCDCQSALILEDALDTHEKLKTLVITDNPLGATGLRNVLRLLCREHTGLTNLVAEGCYKGSGIEDTQIFSYSNPGGKYELQLWRPYHRALLRMLYKTAANLQLNPEEAFKPPDEGMKAVEYRPTPGRGMAPWSHPQPDAQGIRTFPETGELRFVFDVQAAIFKKFMQGGPGGISETDYYGFLNGFYRMMRFKPGFRKVIPLCALWCDLRTDAWAQKVFLNALSSDFNLTMPILEFFCTVTRGALKDIMCTLLPTLGADPTAYFFCGMLIPWLGDYIFVQDQFKNLTAELNLDNPTGHYKLNLSVFADCAAAERLMLLDRWEGALDEKHKRFDVSGNRSHFRNEVCAGRELRKLVRSVAEWKMPDHGEFEFDFISNHRPSREAKILSPALWEALLMKCYRSTCSPEDKISALRSISHLFFLSSSHMRGLIGYFREESERANVFIIFYLRIVDMHNAKMFRVRFENYAEVRRLQSRLGYASFFPFMQPENSRFELDLSVFDQRLAVFMYVYLCIKEAFPRNLHEYGYRVDGQDIPLPLGVPRSWADFNTIPKVGVFRALYRCAPEDRNFACRKEMAEKYGFYDVTGLTADQVAWWTGLMEPPEDVLGLLEFLLRRYDDLQKAFTDIDGAGGNGMVSLQELKEGLEAMECHKFDVKKGAKGGLTKDQRIEAVFRYLDPDGGGTISRQEWAVLSQLRKEFECSMREFVHFLTLTFDDLAEAWEAMDDDGSGRLTESEWLEGVNNIGYFGPSKIVFSCLDKTDEGSIGWEEVQGLERYKQEDPSDPDASARFWAAPEPESD